VIGLFFPQSLLQTYLKDQNPVLLTDDYVPVDNLIAPIFEERTGTASSLRNPKSCGRRGGRPYGGSVFNDAVGGPLCPPTEGSFPVAATGARHGGGPFLSSLLPSSFCNGQKLFLNEPAKKRNLVSVLFQGLRLLNPRLRSLATTASSSLFPVTTSSTSLARHGTGATPLRKTRAFCT